VGKEETIMNLRKTNSLLAGFFLVLLISTTVLAADEQLYGTWRLVSFTRTVLATGETMDAFGKSPHGFINYGRDGRMLVLIVSDKRPKVADLAKMTDQERVELFKSTIAYGGTYTYDGKAVTHHVDISWNENWTGTHVVRQVKFDGNRLALSAAPAPSPEDGRLVTAVLTWERIQ
jgi:Lipocalin-like domain